MLCPRCCCGHNSIVKKHGCPSWQVYAWGRNEEGQLGLGDTAMRRTPTIVDALWALPVQQLAAGDRHSAALTSNGFLFTCGANDRGQLGLPTVAEVAAQNQVCSAPPSSCAISQHSSPLPAICIACCLPYTRAAVCVAPALTVQRSAVPLWLT